MNKLRQRDRAVAEALGWEQCPCSNSDCSFFHTPPPNREYDAELPRFSEDISAAWTLVDYMVARDGVDFYLEYYPKGSQDRWWAVFNDTNHEIHHKHISEYMQLGEAHGATPAAAIVAAFLAALGQ